ncbi:amino acid transporter AVT1I-like [Senna tora]|uniref:Amino acid transporter AVT1I-like n=1 Tax=Senna tora TaxID=362788 RepID=A0A834WM45_9FABA|nr:amino acid transporter AVT1I-like [Senna tora]
MDSMPYQVVAQLTTQAEYVERTPEFDLHTDSGYLWCPSKSRDAKTHLTTCVGILSMPFALSQGGWVSLVLLLSIALVCCYTGLLLQRCMDARPLIKSYPDIGEEAFGFKGRAIVAIFMYLELYLVATEFLILEGDNLHKLFPKMSFEVCGIRIAGKQGFVLMTSLVILPTTWLTSLGVLAYVSVGGVVASVIVVGCVVWVGGFDGVGFHERGKIVNWGGLTTSVSLFAFCYCGHAVFPTLRNSMKNTGQFSKVLLVCFITSTITYGSMAIIVIITPIATAIEDKVLFHKRSRPFGILITRTAILLSTVLVALFIPFFGYLMAFIGSFLSISCSLLLPCLCYLKINKSARRFGLEFMLIIGILLIGSFIAVLGTYSSVRQIVNHLQQKP